MFNKYELVLSNAAIDFSLGAKKYLAFSLIKRIFFLWTQEIT